MASIGREGDSVSLAMDTVQDRMLKDAVNQLCTREQMDPFITKVKTFLDAVVGSREEKQATYARLGFLFGQLAKQGVLGYHHGNDNTANNLLDTLSATCFEKWSSRATEDPSRTLLLKNLDAGQCIEQLTHDFLITHPAVGDIWQQV
jgi:hypothetical protein